MTEIKAVTVKTLRQEWNAWELSEAPSRIKKKEMYSLAKEIRRTAKHQVLSMEEIAFVQIVTDFIKKTAWEYEVPCHKRPSQSPIIGH